MNVLVYLRPIPTGLSRPGHVEVVCDIMDDPWRRLKLSTNVIISREYKPVILEHTGRDKYTDIDTKHFIHGVSEMRFPCPLMDSAELISSMFCGTIG